MALDQAALSDALQAIFESMPDTPDASAEALANAYVDYAQQATFGPNIPASLTAKRAPLKATLLAAIEDPATAVPGALAAAWASGVGTLWTGVAVASVPPATAGSTAGCPGAPSLTGLLTAIYANLANTSATCAQGTAAALHAATLTVTATVSPPPATVVPIA